MYQRVGTLEVRLIKPRRDIIIIIFHSFVRLRVKIYVLIIQRTYMMRTARVVRSTMINAIIIHIHWALLIVFNC